MNKKKIFELLGSIVIAAVSTVVTQIMTDREIEAKVNEAIAEREKKGS